MKRLPLVAAVAMALMPGFALAEGCGYGHQQQVMSCPDGQAYDANSGTCTPKTTS